MSNGLPSAWPLTELLAQAAGLAVGAWRFDANGATGWRDAGYAGIFGHTADPEWSEARFLACVLPADRPTITASLQQARSTGTLDAECRIMRRDGQVRRIRMAGRGQPDGMLAGIAVDVTIQVELEDYVRVQDAIIANVQDGVCLIHAESLELLFTNPRFDAMFGYGERELIGQSFALLAACGAEAFAHSAHEIRAAMNSQGRWEGDALNRRQDGGSFWCHTTLTPFQHREHGELWVCAQTDINTRKHMEVALDASNRALGDMVLHDALTGLFNRRHLDEQAAALTTLARQRGHSVGFVLIDIDHFKRVNDTLGHDAGDKVLKEIGNMLGTHTRGTDTVCRYGGEEFVILMPRASTDNATLRAEQLRELIAGAKIQIGGIDISVTISAGVACFPEDGDSAQSVITCADARLYEAKHAGRNRVCNGQPA